jgi:hypothetical protein
MTPAERAAEYEEDARFRIARVAAEGQEWVGGGGAQTPAGIMLALQMWTDEGMIDPAVDRLGIMDTGPWQDGEPGRWLINPYVKETT